MKKLTPFLGVLFALAFSSSSYANITGLDFWGSSGVVCSYTNYTVYGNSGTANITDTQSGMGDIYGTISTDTATDPSLTINGSTVNSTGGAWLGYQINVSMSQSFTLSAVSVSIPAGWSLVLLSQPTLIGPSDYQGTMAFSGSTSVPIGGTFAFSYTMNFNNSTNYSFTQQMIPSFTTIPEPGTMAFAALGGVLFCGINLVRRSSRTR